ncbi:MAG: hypothetical protein C4B55_04975 [Candidatus Methanophagaceae archaeon]|nr:MAG: hypothetical protein C4B55_04975 [Methanophagales archaeon]
MKKNKEKQGKENSKKIGVGVLAVATVLLSAFPTPAAAAVAGTVAGTDNAVKIVAFTTDKEVYCARETVKVVLTVYSSENVSDALIEVAGVRSKRGVNYISYSNKTNLTAGENTVTFSRTLPSCSKCAGIYEGTYFINASVVCEAEGEVVNATHSIEITSSPGRRNPVRIIFVNEAQRMQQQQRDGGEVVLLDVRPNAEFKAGHLKGATSIPLAELSNRAAELEKSKKIVVFSEDGRNSSRACEILVEQDFDQIYNVFGGMNAWQESGFEVVSDSDATSGTEQPGFEAVLAVAGLLAVVFWLRKGKSKSRRNSRRRG